MEAQEIPRNRGLLFANQYPAKAKGDTGSSPACNIAKNFSNDITCPFISSDSLAKPPRIPEFFSMAARPTKI